MKTHKKNKRLESKYIASLMEQNKKREQAYELVVERKMHKEIETDKTEYGDKEKFMTAAYKQKLQERILLEQEEAKSDAKDAADDVTKKKDIHSFYFNLRKNIAMGGSEKPPEPEQKPTKIPSATSQPPMETKSISSDHHSPVSHTSPHHKGSRSRSPSPHRHHDRSRSPKGRSRSRSRSPNQRHHHRSHRSPSGSHSSREDLRYSSHSKQSSRKRARSKSPEVTALEELTRKNQGEDEETKRKELVKKLKLDKQTNEDTVNAARQRYLERLKNKATGNVISGGS